jgi:hypothetical protein
MESTGEPSVEKMYKGRPHDACPVNFSLTREAASLLLQYAETSPRARGAFLSRLVIEYDRRKRFLEFLQVDVRRELKKIGQQVRKDLRQQNGV